MPSAVKVVPTSLIDRGDYYRDDNETIGLLQRLGEYAVRISPGGDIRAVTTKGVLAGFQVEREIENGIFILRSESGAVPIGPTGAGIDWITPLFQSKDYGAWLVPTNEIIVALKPGVTAEQFFAGDQRFSGYRRLTGTPDQFIGTVASGAGRNALTLSNDLARDPRLRWSTPNTYQDWQKHFVPNDALFNQQWHLRNTGQNGSVPGADVKAVQAWDVIQGGSPNVVISVVDDCMEITHPDLQPNIYINPGEVPGNGIDDDGNGYIDDVNGYDFTKDTGNLVPSVRDAHATSVGGIAAARGNNSIGVAGIAFNSRLISVRIFGDTGAATSAANIASAVYYAAGRTADGLGTFRSGDITNNSWGGGAPSAAITSAFTWASDQGRGGKGVLSFISSGNGGVGTIAYPSRMAGTLSGVASVGSSNDLDVRSSYSQYGPELDFLAPSDGGNFGTVTTDRVGTLGYNTAAGAAGNYTNTAGSAFGGTSSASPLAAGIGALVLARNTNLTAAQIRGLMRNTTDLIAPSDASYDALSGFSLKYGYGKVNAFTAVSGVGIAKVQVLSGSSIVASGSGSINFGAVTIGGYADITLRLRNQGTETLNLTGLSFTNGPFSAVGGFGSTSLPAGGVTTFTLRFAPTAIPAANATVTIASNDPAGPYTFTLTGTGVQPSIAGAVYEDWNGNGVRDANDPGLANAIAYIDVNGNGQRDVTTNTYDSTDVPKPIPDNNPAGATSVLNITDLGQVASITLTLTITHTWVSDLTAYLISPSGKQIELFSGVGGSGDNFTGTTFDDNAAQPITAGTPPFSGTFRPNQPLSTFIGDAANGTWRLKVVDAVQLDVGTIQSWSLTMGISEPFAKSDANGFYAFVNLPAGTYSVGQAPATGFKATGPAANYTINLPANGSVSGNDFGQNRLNAIYGVQFGDLNGDGVRDPGEPLLPGWTVYHDTNNNGTFDILTNSFPAAGLPIPIPDMGTARSSIAVSGLGGAVAKVTVTLTIAHTYVEDLTAVLVGPDGTRVTLFNRVGGAGHNFTNTTLDDAATTSITAGTAPFTGTFKPQQLLAAFNNKSANGNWTLEVTDNFPGDTGNIFAWSINIGFTEPFQVTDALGNYRFDTLPPATYILREVPQSGFTPTAPPGGAYSVPLAANQTVVNRDFGVQVTSPPSVTGVVIGDGSNQRSRIEQLRVDFSNVVSFVGAPSAAFRLEKIVGGVPAGTVGINVATAVVGGHTQATITFTSDTQFGSLADGRYRLTVIANQVTLGGVPMSADHVTNFHRYYGDANGDARVDIADFGLFSTTYNRQLGQSGYLGYFDFNNDNRVDIVDFGQFSLRYFTTLP